MTASPKVYPPYLPWAEFHTHRHFCITADQDWAPEWASKAFLAWAEAHGLRPHVFTTNHSAAMSAAAQAGRITQGWHPNFGAGSTHGTTPAEVIDHLSAVAPEATTFRTHRFSESSDALGALADAGHRVESQFPTLFSRGIVPLVHASGLVRLPVWFEDDIWMRDGADGDQRVGSSIDSPGLKILNLHPIHIALNSPDFHWYNQHRPDIYGSADGLGLEFTGRGARVVAEEILELARADGSLTDFPTIAARALELSAESRS